MGEGVELGEPCLELDLLANCKEIAQEIWTLIGDYMLSY